MNDPFAEAREIDRALNAATDPAEMRSLISRRRLVRAALDFDRAMELIEIDHPIQHIEPAFKTIEEWRRLGRI